MKRGLRRARVASMFDLPFGIRGSEAGDCISPVFHALPSISLGTLLGRFYSVSSRLSKLGLLRCHDYNRCELHMNIRI